MNPIVFVVLAAVLIGVAFYLVALPLLREARRHAAPLPVISEQEHLAELLARRDAAFQALRDLNFDFKVGKITNEDFVAFEANLKQNAANTLRALDQWEAEADDELDLVMEEAISSRKGQLSGSAGAAPDGRVCAKCGKRALAGDRFCGACGAALPAAAAPGQLEQLACPKCGQPHVAGDKFCASCGHVLVTEVAPAG